MSVCECMGSYFGAHEEVKLSWQSSPWCAKARSVTIAGVRNYMGKEQWEKKLHEVWKMCVLLQSKVFLVLLIMTPYKA